MSKVSYEPNNTKNGHLGAKLEPIENWKFSKIRFHTPTLVFTIEPFLTHVSHFRLLVLKLLPYILVFSIFCDCWLCCGPHILT